VFACMFANAIPVRVQTLPSMLAAVVVVTVVVVVEIEVVVVVVVVAVVVVVVVEVVVHVRPKAMQLQLAHSPFSCSHHRGVGLQCLDRIDG